MLVHSMLARSTVNGPGERAVVWLQGCSLRCPGCWNPSTHAFDRSRDMPVEEVGAWILSCRGVEGVTFSGGEPLLQDQGVMEFLHLVKTYTNLSVLIFSGLTLTEIKRRLKKNKTEEILARVDI